MVRLSYVYCKHYLLFMNGSERAETKGKGYIEYKL